MTSVLCKYCGSELASSSEVEDGDVVTCGGCDQWNGDKSYTVTVTLPDEIKETLQTLDNPDVEETLRQTNKQIGLEG